MNTSTTILAALVLAVLIIAAVFAAVQGTISVGDTGVGNLSDRADKGDDGEYDFTSYRENTPEKTNPAPITTEKVTLV